MQVAINLKADLHHSLSPYPLPHPTPHPHPPLGSCMDPHLFSLPAGKGRDGHYAVLLSWASDVEQGCLSAKHISMPCLHEQRWWNKLNIRARTSNFCLFTPEHFNSFQGDFWIANRDSPWIIHYLLSISLHSNRQPILAWPYTARQPYLPNQNKERASLWSSMVLNNVTCKLGLHSI